MKRILSVQPLINSQRGNFWCFTLVRNIESPSCQELFDNSEFWSRRRSGRRTMKWRMKGLGLDRFVFFVFFYLLLLLLLLQLCNNNHLYCREAAFWPVTLRAALEGTTPTALRESDSFVAFSQYLTRGLVAEPSQFTLLIQCSFVGDQHHWKY